MELQNLSKEQLIELLKNKDVVEEENQICKYISKTTNKKCTDGSTTPWGYCNKHKNTMQGKKEKKNWEALQNNEVEEENEYNNQIENNNQISANSAIDYNNPLDSDGVKMYEDINSGNIDPSSQNMFFNTGGGYASNTDLTKLNPKNSSETQAQNLEQSTPSLKKVNQKPKKVKKHKTLKIGRNIFGRFEEPRTHLLFDPETHEVYGVQGQTGNVLPLANKHYEICRKKGWKYYEDDESESESDSDSINSEDEESDAKSSEEDEYDSDY